MFHSQLLTTTYSFNQISLQHSFKIAVHVGKTNHLEKDYNDLQEILLLLLVLLKCTVQHTTGTFIFLIRCLMCADVAACRK